MGGLGAEFYTKCRQIEKEYGQGFDSSTVADAVIQYKAGQGEYIYRDGLLKGSFAHAHLRVTTTTHNVIVQSCII